MGAMLRFGALDEPMYARRAADTGEAVLVPQVPQREVRTQVRPEFHQCLDDAGFYSAMSAPIVGSGVVRGAVLGVPRHAGPAVHVRRSRLRRRGGVARSAPRSRRPSAGHAAWACARGS